MAGTRIKTLTLQTCLPYLLIFASVVGLLASFTLTYDKIHVLQNPSYDPACNINPILSCGSVMKTQQANVLGVPNTIFGLVAFTMLGTLGAILAAGAQLKRWIWVCAQIAATLGVVFMHYLFFQGVYRINAICPWCLTVWMVTIPVFWYITLRNLELFADRLPTWGRRAATFARNHHADILMTWYAIILLILLEHFWYYWSTLI
jgi:uncharacterized membrane protein